MGLAMAVIIYWLLRKHGVSKRWSVIATLPVLFDGFMIEDEHLIMAETVFTFSVMIALLLVMRTRRMSWWAALIAGLLLGYGAIVRTEGAPLLLLFPLFLLLRGWRVYGWRRLQGWLVAIVMAVGCAAPVAGYVLWFKSYSGNFGITESTGYYLWGRVSSFADCARIKPVGAEAAVCPKKPVRHRTAPGNYIWHAPEVHKDLKGGPVTPASNKLLTGFAIHAVEAQPLGYAKAIAKGLVMSVSWPRQQYPGRGTVYYYYFHRHPYSIPYHSWIKGGYANQDWVAYGHAKPGKVIEPFAAFMIGYQRVFYTWGPLLGIILAVGLGGLIRVRRPVRAWRLTREQFPLHWAPRGTSMLPWVIAVVMLVTPIALADFDYRYLLPVIPFACLAAGLAFTPYRSAGTATAPSGPSKETTAPEVTPV
jgi:4-amino-4-deoxy-L-arabinose transferase-like glycosyltransferase